jgi:DNA-binding MarR family transcriptional regulator
MTRSAHAATRAPAPRAAAARPSAPAPAHAPAHSPDLSRLLTYNLSLLANMLSRGAAARYSREFGVTLMEWRVIGSLALETPMSLQQISHRFDLDKGQSSRTVAALLGRGLVHRSVNGDDRRSLALKLTPAGWRLYRRIVQSARARSERLLGCLGAAERKTFMHSLGKLMAEARGIYAEERSRPNGSSRGRAYSGLRKPHA